MFEKIKNYPGEVLTRLLAIFLSVLFFYYFPFLVFVSYMGYKGFFSYDLLAVGRVGIDVFYAVGEFLVVLLSVALFGVVTQVVRSVAHRHPSLRPPYAREIKVSRGDRFGTWALGGLNALMIILVVMGVYRRSGDWEFPDLVFSFIHLSILGIWVNAHIGVVIYMRAKAVLGSLLMGAMWLVYIVVAYPLPLVRFMDLSLQYFGVGGGLQVSLHVREGGEIKNLEGKLLFLSPENVYLLPPGVDGHILIVQRRDAIMLDIKNLSGFGHRGQHSS
ncbi:hypothetical protein [Burkholderia sp. 3C]